MKTIIESTELKSIKEIYNQPLFSDYYIKTWPIFNSDFQEIVDLQNIINNYYA